VVKRSCGPSPIVELEEFPEKTAECNEVSTSFENREI